MLIPCAVCHTMNKIPWMPDDTTPLMCRECGHHFTREYVTQQVSELNGDIVPDENSHATLGRPFIRDYSRNLDAEASLEIVKATPTEVELDKLREHRQDLLSQVDKLNLALQDAVAKITKQDNTLRVLKGFFDTDNKEAWSLRWADYINLALTVQEEKK